MLSPPTPLQGGLRLAAVAYLVLLVARPASRLVREGFADGPSTFFDIFKDPKVVHALELTAQVAVQAVLINLVFGVGISLLLVRYRSPGKRVLSALIALPMAVSPGGGGLS